MSTSGSRIGWIGTGRMGHAMAERLLAQVRAMVYARSIDMRTADSGYGLETELADPDPDLVAAAANASAHKRWITSRPRPLPCSKRTATTR